MEEGEEGEGYSPGIPFLTFSISALVVVMWPLVQPVTKTDSQDR